jgi:hypothetical protein
MTGLRRNEGNGIFGVPSTPKGNVGLRRGGQWPHWRRASRRSDVVTMMPRMSTTLYEDDQRDLSRRGFVGQEPVVAISSTIGR